MILSVSRRTDIPAFYCEWFMNRVREGFAYVRNPFNPMQVSRVDIRPEVVDCIVFCTKNARPLMPYLNELDDLGYKYYFQFTVTPYGRDMEGNIPSKSEIVDTFKQLANMIGTEKVIWRYDPIIITDQYGLDYHIESFRNLCRELKDCTKRVVISFVDHYRKIAHTLRQLQVRELSQREMVQIAAPLAAIAREHGMVIESCAEAIDLSAMVIKHGRCIDGDLIESIVGCEIRNKNTRDANRAYCGCMKSIDIGQYDTCIHGCQYCYANVSPAQAYKNYQQHDPRSPILCGDYDESLIKDRPDTSSYRIKADEAFKQGILFPGAWR